MRHKSQLVNIQALFRHLRIPGVHGTAAATGVSAILFLPVAAAVFVSRPPDPFTGRCAVGAGVLASVVPYLADLVALRRVPSNVFGVLMSINPEFAALIGALVLHEHLGIAQWCGIGLIVVADASALLFRGRGGGLPVPDGPRSHARQPGHRR
jgi:inner membrane transporter RhtA